ncbi:Protein CBG26594 [Caenorhabditis briggsae]|uniref:Protein CBG26594 n=1 Tax=Caenorhabditis briggsae TaxID=6238 RepID=B6IKZ4_CAEBR|nr:Protein CBG26594 [Caenorhabditis briggsae]CAS00574.1 Protein CBG26594 [Caenorhabditis briggsae]
MNILKYLGQTQKSIKFGHVDLSHYAADNLSEILDNLKIVEDLELDMSSISEFVKNEFRIWEFKNLTMSNEFWLDFPCLLDSEIVKISGNKLSNKDVNRFLKFWKMGGALKMRNFTLEVVEMDFERIFEGIEYKKSSEK